MIDHINRTPKRMKLLCLFASLTFFSCSSHRQLVKTVASQGDYCAPLAHTARSDTSNLRRNVDSVLSGPFRYKFSKHALLVANAAGMLPVLNELVEMKSGGNQRESEVYKKRLQIIGQIELMMAEVSSLEAELNCERNRCEQVISYLSKIQEEKIRKSTIYSILVSAATGIALVFIKDEDHDKVVGVTGGALAAAYGIRALLIKDKIEFVHEHNLLSDVWHERKYSKIYPQSIWFALNEKEFLDDYNNTINYYFRLSFSSMLEHYSKKHRSAIEGKLFGNSGLYTIDELQLRLNMLSLVSVGVGIITNDLKIFIQEVLHY